MIGPSSRLAVDAAPIIYYSPARYRIMVTMGLIVAVALLAYGIVQGYAADAASGFVGLLLVGLFAFGVKDKMRNTGVALTREGDLLVGGELKQPLLISQTTFEITSNYEGSWVVALHNQDKVIRLGAGGWRVEGERFITKAVAQRLLLGLGLKALEK